MEAALKVLLHATGEERKLWPLTSEIPSPMLPVLNRPVMAYAIESLARQQVRDIQVSIYEISGAVEAYFGEGRRWGVHLDYRLQRQAWKDAGALRWAFSHTEGTLLLFPADILIDLNLEAALEAHRQQGAAVTVVQAKAGTAKRGDSPVQDTGVYLLEASVLQFVPPRTPVSIGAELIHQLTAMGWVTGSYVSAGYYNPLTDFKEYYAAPFELLEAGGLGRSTAAEGEGKAGMLHSLSIQGRLLAPGIWVGRNNQIHHSAQLFPPVYLSSNTRIGRKASVGPYVVLGEHNIVSEEACLEKSVLLGESFVGRCVYVKNRIVHRNLLIDPQSGEHVYLPDPFLLADAQPQQVAGSLERVFDIGAALLALAALSPLMLVCALFLWLTGAPVFHVEDCLHSKKKGHNLRLHQPFRRVWFNTRRADGRPSRLGALIQALELHRMPEWLNVLRGEMSVVGVKPLPVAEVQAAAGDQPFGEEWQMKRFNAPAGLTGIWYLRTSPHSSLQEVLVTDAFYVATRSVQGNVHILLQTPLTWLRRIFSMGRSDHGVIVQSHQ